MSRLDTSGMRSLWYRIGDIFARKAHAVGSLSLVVTTLNWLNIDGSALGNINLGNTFATRSQAGHSLSIANRTITLHSVDNTNLGSVTVPESPGEASGTYHADVSRWLAGWMHAGRHHQLRRAVSWPTSAASTAT